MDKAALKNHSFITNLGLADKEVAAVAKVCESIKVTAETIIFQQDDAADGMYLTTTSPVEITTTITQKLEKILYTVPPDSVFGEMALLDEAPRSASAHAAEDGNIIRIPRDGFLGILENDANLGLKLMRGLYDVVTDRLRAMDAAYAQNIRWGLEVSGATKLDFSELITGDTPITLTLNGGQELKGRIVKVADTSQGLELTIAAADCIHIVPYASVNMVTFANRGEDLLLEETG